MWEILRLIRLRSIAFTAFCLYATRDFVLRSLLYREGFALQLSGREFSILVIAICCLVAAAYVINDYFDSKSDRLSGAKRVIVGRSMTRRQTMVLHTILNLVAIVAAFYLGIRVNCLWVCFVFLAISVLLWFYSFRYKKIFMWGNLIVAALTALIPLVVVGFEWPLLTSAYADILVKTGENFNYIFYWTLFFSYFLFLNTWMYEINKDIYSLPGDRDERVVTLPVRLGIEKTRQVIIGITAIAIISLLVLYFMVFYPSLEVAVYFTIALILPYFLYLKQVLNSENRKLQLRLIRLIMVLGMGFGLLLQSFFTHKI